MAINLPASLKLLKQLTYKCGMSSTGTKATLSQRLTDEISRERDQGPIRVLSIDMGIRNLAYCVLDFPPKPLVPSASAEAAHLPLLIDWQRLAVTKPPVKTSPPTKEKFEPATLAVAACKLVREHFLIANPSKILIERQRYRSMGSPLVLEWTLRVNMLESMLYAVFQALREEGKWKGDVVPISPGSVGPFWVGEDHAKVTPVQADAIIYKKKRASQNTKLINKGLKIDLVRKWLQQKDMFVLGNTEVEGTADAYVRKWDRLPGGTKGKTTSEEGTELHVDEPGKLDDLADCLLQGMAWGEWERNKAFLSKHDLQSVINLKQPAQQKTTKAKKTKHNTK